MCIDGIISRHNSITPLFLWYAIARFGKSGLLQRARESMAIAEYAVQELRQAGIAAWRNQSALTVIFPQPPQKVCDKWQLASENETSHLICMPGVTKKHIDVFVYDCKEAIGQPACCDNGWPAVARVL